MPHKTPFPPAVTRFGSQRRHTENKTRFLRQNALKLITGGSRSLELDFDEITASQAAKDEAAAREVPAARHSRTPGQATRTRVVWALRASRSEPLGCGVPRSGGVPPLLCRQPRRGSFGGMPAETADYASSPRVRHNPSLNHRTHYGGPSWPGLGYAVHFPNPGQAIPPQRSG